MVCLRKTQTVQRAPFSPAFYRAVISVQNAVPGFGGEHLDDLAVGRQIKVIDVAGSFIEVSGKHYGSAINQLDHKVLTLLQILDDTGP